MNGGENEGEIQRLNKRESEREREREREIVIEKRGLKSVREGNQMTDIF